MDRRSAARKSERDGGAPRSSRTRPTNAGPRTAAEIGLWNAVYLERVVATLLVIAVLGEACGAQTVVGAR